MLHEKIYTTLNVLDNIRAISLGLSLSCFLELACNHVPLFLPQQIKVISLWSMNAIVAFQSRDFKSLAIYLEMGLPFAKG